MKKNIVIVLIVMALLCSCSCAELLVKPGNPVPAVLEKDAKILVSQEPALDKRR